MVVSYLYIDSCFNKYVIASPFCSEVVAVLVLYLLSNKEEIVDQVSTFHGAQSRFASPRR